MKRSVAVIAALLLLVASRAGAQDMAEGTVLAFDRKANILVFTDKSVWPLHKLGKEPPAGLKAGDRVTLSYRSNEDDGVTEIHSIELIE